MDAPSSAAVPEEEEEEQQQQQSIEDLKAGALRLLEAIERVAQASAAPKLPSEEKEA